LGSATEEEVNTYVYLFKVDDADEFMPVIEDAQNVHSGVARA
jgi:hypothetical protein